jgi:hypothetical protein
MQLDSNKECEHLHKKQLYQKLKVIYDVAVTKRSIGNQV